MKKFALLSLIFIICLNILVPVGAKKAEDIPEKEWDARMLFTKYTAAMTSFSACYDVEGLDNLDFNGATTKDNIDRILTTAIYLEYQNPKANLKFIVNSNGNFAITPDQAKELVQKYYTIPKTDFTKSSFYHKAVRKIVITQKDLVSDFVMPTVYIKQNTFSYSVEDTGNGVIFATLKGWVITGNDGGSGYLEMVLQVPDKDLSKAKLDNTRIASVKVTEPVKALSFDADNDLRKKDVGYYKYLAPETTVADMVKTISSDSVKSKLTVYDAKGNVKTNGIVCTGDYVLDAEDPESPWNYLVMVVENDLNGDGKKSIEDYNVIADYLNGKITIDDAACFIAADLVRDGKISSNDFMSAKKIYDVK